MKLFVLGGTGFIGRVLVGEAVRQGVQVTALVRSMEGGEAMRALGATPLLGTVARSDSWQEALSGADAIVDLLQPALPGRITLEAIQRVADERRAATAALLERLAGLPLASRPLLVNVSGTDDLKPDANGRIRADSPLAEPPRGFGHIGIPVRRQIEAAGVDAVFVMLGTVYGPGKTFGERIVPGLRKGSFPILGSGRNHLPLVHVEDAARALLQLAGMARDAVRGRTFLVADGTGTTQGELLRGVAARMNAPAPLRVPRALGALVAGRIAVETMTRDLHDDPEALLRTGFRFRYPSWREGLTPTLQKLGLEAPLPPAFGRLRALAVALLGLGLIATMVQVNVFAPSGVPGIQAQGGRILDSQLFYGPAHIGVELTAMGPSGRALYARLLSHFDRVFPFCCALFGALFLRGWQRAGVRWLGPLWWSVPLLGAAADLLENQALLSALRAHPAAGSWDAWAGPLTLTKWLGYGATLLLIVLGALASRKRRAPPSVPALRVA